jgi:YesN/AraC family two-component response regulator
LGALADMVVVGEAAYGVAGVETGRRIRPDFVVFDVRLPHLDGF